jgi:hypothetical protein
LLLAGLSVLHAAPPVANAYQDTCLIHGTVTGDICSVRTPLAGVYITGLDVTTNENGQYSKSVPLGSLWCIAPQLAPYFFMEDCRHISADGDRQSDFTGYVSQVSGRVTTADGAGVPDVALSVQQVAADTVSTTTDADGRYSVIVGWGYTCTATPSKADCAFDPPSRALGAVWSCAENQDFVATCAAPPEPDPNDTPPADTNGDATAPTDSNQPADGAETQPAEWPFRCGAGACGAGLVGPWIVTLLSLRCLRRRHV